MTATRARLVAAVLAASSLALAQQPPHPAQGGYSIRGVVVSAKTGKPLDRASVTLSNADTAARITETTTGEDGSFDFERLLPGRYGLHASRRGYNAANYDEHEGFFSAIVTGPGLDTAGLRMKLLPEAVIGGVVTDDAGEPVRGVQINLYRKYSFDGLGKITQARGEQTDDVGAFEFTRLGPGDYFVSVNATPWYATRPQPKLDVQGNPLPDTQSTSSPLDVAYPITFYPDATDSDDATPIPVRAGDRVQLNFSLHAVPAVHLHIHIPRAEVATEISASGVFSSSQIVMPQITQNIFGQPVPIPSMNSAYSPGTAEVGGVPPGHYEIRFPGANGQGGAESSLDLTADATIESPPFDAGVEIRGKVAMMTGDAPPPSLTIILGFSPAGSNRGELIAKDGTFTMKEVPAGTYGVGVGGPGTPLFIVRMLVDGASTVGHQLKVGATPVNLVLMLAQKSATIDGYAKQNGKAMEGAMVILVPHDPETNPELFRRDQSNSDGSFSLKNVAPGAYTLIAIEDGWSLDWARPEVISHYTAHGLKINVALSQKSINISGPVEVQPRQ